MVDDQKPMITAERLRQVLAYDDATGKFKWRLTISSHGVKNSIAGTVGKRGYRHIQIDGRVYRACRLAWLHVHGVWPSGVLIFKDKNSDNLAISNLIDADKSTRMQRQTTAHKQNASGLIGATFHKKSGKWAAQIRKKGLKKQHYGLFDKPEDAHAEYLRQKAIHHRSV